MSRDAVKQLLFRYLDLLVMTRRNNYRRDKRQHRCANKEVHGGADVVSEIDQVGCNKWCRTTEYGYWNVVGHRDARCTNLSWNQIGHDCIGHRGIQAKQHCAAHEWQENRARGCTRSHGEEPPQSGNGQRRRGDEEWATSVEIRKQPSERHETCSG